MKQLDYRVNERNILILPYKEVTSEFRGFPAEDWVCIFYINNLSNQLLDNIVKICIRNGMRYQFHLGRSID